MKTCIYWLFMSLLFVHSLKSFAQTTLEVKGKITDVTGEPLSSVTVHISGTTQGTISDMNGNFSIHIPKENSKVAFTLMGFISQEVHIKGKAPVLNIVLLEDTKLLDEVVFVGYGTLKKSSIATAITSVKPEEFNTGGGQNALKLLEGKVAGLTITRNNGNNPNAATSIQLRGLTSLTGTNTPLVVIDGIPGGNMDLIQPDDIESFEVLKDGSAAAIYGSKANAGVILITTKKGTKGAAKLDYSTYITKFYLTKRPDFMNADEYRAYKADPNNSKSNSMTDFGYNTDFYGELLNKNNLSQYHNIAISGGAESMNYRGSIFYNDYSGIAKENSRKNYGARVSLGGKAFDDIISSQINMATNYNDANLLGGGGWEGSLTRNPTQSVYREDGTFWEDPTTTSELARFAQEKYNRIQQSTSVDGHLGISPLKSLELSVFGSILRDSYEDNYYKDRDSKASYQSYQGGGYAKKEFQLSTNTAFEPTIKFMDTFSKHHHLNALAGYSYQYKVSENFNAWNAGFLNDAFEENNLEAGSYLKDGKAGMGSHKEDETLIAFFGRVNYTFKDRYIVQASLRREGSSKFGENHKWGNFPAASLAWNAINEEFMKQFSSISNLKLRVGYGVTGNSGITNYNSIVKLGPGGNYLFSNGTWGQTYGPTTNPNKNLRWERKEELNLGIDFAFLKNRIGGSIDIYQRKTKDLLENYVSQVPSNVNNRIYTNVGTISNKGIEITLNAVPVSTQKLIWKSDFTFSSSTNKLESFSNDVYSIDYKEYGQIGFFGDLGNAIRTYEGDPIGNFYGKRFAGLDAEGKWLFYTKDNKSMVYADKITDADKSVIGNAVPKVYLSWSNYLRYKNIDFSMSFRGKFGFDVLNTTDILYGNKVSTPTNLLNNATTKHAGINDTYQYSDYYLEDGSFLKLDNLTVGYNFKSKSKSSKIPPFRAYVTGRDLLTFTNYSGLDPEVKDTGLDPGLEIVDRYPVTRGITVGLNITF